MPQDCQERITWRNVTWRLYHGSVAKGIAPEESSWRMITMRLPTEQINSSPIRSEKIFGLFRDPPSIRILSDAYSDEEDSPVATIEESIKLLKAHATDVETKWSSTFNEVESCYMLLVDDIRRLYDATKAIHSTLDIKSRTFDGFQFTMSGFERSHQEALSRLSVISSQSEAARDEAELATAAISELKQDLQDAAHRLNIAEERLVAYGKRFENIRPVVAKFRELWAATERYSNVDATVIEDRFTSMALQLERLSKRVDEAAETSWDSFGPSAGHSSKAVEELLRDTKERIKRLEQRIVGDGVSLGNTVFQSFDELKTWTVSELPKFRYGLFVDAGGLLDMFAFIGFTDFEKTTASLSNVQKTGFATMHEARLTASMQNVLPSIFGKPTAEGMDSSEFLPAISDPDKWDNGTTGLNHQIARAMIDVEFQLDSTINMVFDSYPAARQLAKDCLYQSKRFVTDFCNFVTNEVKAWLQRGHSKKEAWRILCVCIRRIFEELHSARVVARDIRDTSDPAFTAAKILWAVLKAHAVMSSYVKHRFKEHSSIAAVIACHLAANFHKTDDGLSAEYTLLEGKLKTLTARLDRLEAKQENDRGGPKKGKKADKGPSDP